MPRLATIKQLARPTGAIAFTAAGPALGGAAALGLAYVHADTLRDGGLPIVALLLIGGAVACGLAVMPTHVLSLLCGWSLGLPFGLTVALLGATLGAPLGYGLGKLLAGPGLLDLAKQNPKGAAVCDAITRASPIRAAWLVGLLRLSPIVPYGSTNVLAAAFAVPMLPLLAGTFIGLAPRAAAAVAIGAGLERLDSDTPASPWLWGLGIGATLLAVVYMGWYAKRALAKLAEAPKQDPTR